VFDWAKLWGLLMRRIEEQKWGFTAKRGGFLFEERRARTLMRGRYRVNGTLVRVASQLGSCASERLAVVNRRLHSLRKFGRSRSMSVIAMLRQLTESFRFADQLDRVTVVIDNGGLIRVMQSMGR
jgi:hypothetical protein